MKANEIFNSQEYKGDNNCCTVVCLSVIADIPFKEAQAHCAKFGRKKNKGFGNYLKAYNEYVEMTKCSSLSLWEGKQVRTFMRDAKSFIQKSTIVILTSRHIFAVKNGNIEDWMNENRAHPIRKIWLVQPKVSKFKNQSGSEYTIQKRKQGGWLLTRTATGKTEVITQAMHDKTLKRLYDGEVIPFRSISYTVAIEQAVLFLLIDHVHIDPFKRVYSVRKPRKVIKLKR